MEEVRQLKDKVKYTASVFKDVEFNYGVNFVGKELYNNIGKNDKVYGMELFLKEDIKSAVELLKGMLKELDCKHDKLIDYCFPDLYKKEQALACGDCGGKMKKKTEDVFIPIYV